MNLLDKYLKYLEEIYSMDKVLAIVVFGSYATGRVKNNSDLDVCVLLDNNAQNNLIDEIKSYGNDELDISIFSELPIAVKYEIFNHGNIYNSKISLREIKIKTRNAWFDYRVHLNKFYKKRGYGLVK